MLVGTIALAALLVLAAAAYAGYVLTRSATLTQSVGCYDRASLQSFDVAIVSLDGRRPEAICADEWAGAFPQVVKPKQFAACVLASGAIGVFPASGADTCARLGVARLETSAAARVQQRKFALLRDALAGQVHDASCLGFATASGRVRKTLDEHGFADWRIEAGGVHGDGFSARRPCAILDFDEQRRTVILVPETRPGHAYPALTPAQLKRIAALRDVLAAQVNEQTCLSEETANARVRQTLERRGFGSWQVIERLGRHSSNRCARFVVEPPIRSVTVLPPGKS